MMTKIRYRALLCCLIIIAPSVYAGSVSVTEGLLYWNTNNQGVLKAPDFQGYELKLDKKSFQNSRSAMYFVDLEHSVKWLPRWRLAYTYLNNKGDAQFTFNSTLYPINDGTVDLSHIDITPYYTVVDSVVRLDIGLSARIFHGEISGRIDDGSTSGFKMQSPLNSTYALLYLHFDVPVAQSGVAFGTLLNAGGTNKEKASDIDIYMHYLSPVGIGLSLGYRYLDAELKSKGKAQGSEVDVKANFKIHGPYLGLLLRF